MKKTAFAASMILVLSLCSCGSLPLEDIVIPPDETSTEEIYTEETTVPRTIDLSEFSLPDFSSEPDEPEDAPVTAPEEESPTTPAEETKVAGTTAAVSSEAAPAETTASPVTAPAEETKKLPDGCINVPYLSQEELPTGCELVSTSMLLRYYGFDISPEALIREGWVETEIIDADEPGSSHLFSGDPNKVFIGDPTDKHGYGCYSGAIKAGLYRYLDGKYFDIIDLSGNSLKDICQYYVELGQPVLIWGTVGMEPVGGKPPVTWTVIGTDEEFTWLPNEHCVLLVGCDEEFYYFNDPKAGKAVPYERGIVEERYRDLGMQALTIHPWGSLY